MFSCARPPNGCQVVGVSSLAFGVLHLCLGELGAAPVGSGSRVRREWANTGPVVVHACNQWWVKGRSRAGPERVNIGARLGGPEGQAFQQEESDFIEFQLFPLLTKVAQNRL